MEGYKFNGEEAGSIIGEEKNDSAMAENYHAIRLKRERLHSILILSVGFLTVIVGGFSLFFNISNPFSEILRQGIAYNETLAKQQEAELLAQQTKDTDNDGLSDYLEINQYETSPYLEDTDGDGITDKAEIDAGEDPNCPQGQMCFSTAGNTNDSGQTTNGSTAGTADSRIVINADYVRNLMKQNGATDEQLEGATDEELMAEFKQYLQNNPDTANYLASQGVDLSGLTGDSSATAAAGNADLSSLNIKSADDLKNLTGAQVRQLMISAGASESLLGSLTDDELKEMFLKQLQSKLSEQTSSAQ